MKILEGKKIRLRAMEPNDTGMIYQWENDTDSWKYSNIYTPFSRFFLEQYLINSNADIYTDKQLRLIIDDGNSGDTVGCTDLFEFDPHHKRAGAGILIAPRFRNQGYASDALDVLITYAKSTLGLQQLFCNITQDNSVSLRLFQSKGFIISGTKKRWIRQEDAWLDEHLLQLLF